MLQEVTPPFLMRLPSHLRCDPGGLPALTGNATFFLPPEAPAAGGGVKQSAEDVPSQVTGAGSSGNT